MAEETKQIFTTQEADQKIKQFVDLLQESNKTSEKFVEIQKFQELLLNKGQFNLTSSQIEYLLEGNDEENIVGLCQFAGRKQYLEGSVKRSSIAALMMIHALLTDPSNKILVNLSLL